MGQIKKEKHYTLLLCNIFLMLLVIIGAWFYARGISRVQAQSKMDGFIRTIENMKTVTMNYIDSEMGYVRDWSSYITQNDMDLNEALDYLNNVNTNPMRYVHILDVDTYEAYSNFYENGEEPFLTYQHNLNVGGSTTGTFETVINNLFNGDGEHLELLGKYRIPETQAMSVALGMRVTIKTEAGYKDYLLLRIIPINELQKAWVFPTDYSNAEVGIITINGGYVVPSISMRSESFVEYIRGYNFQGDYNRREEVVEQLQNNSSGIMEYKNYKGEDCIWYYSSFGENSVLDILGVMNKAELETNFEPWRITIIIASTLIILMVVDGIFLNGINRRLSEALVLAEQASNAKTSFLSAMSHDIRTPLNAVIGMMKLASNKPDDSKYVSECMRKGLESGENLLGLINDVLDISRIESGHTTLNLKNISIVDLINDLLAMQAMSSEQKGIDIQCDLSGVTHDLIYADQMRLTQIYSNLLTNAIKYTNEGGKIEIKLYDEEVSGNDDKTRMVFVIKDNGIGMSEEFQQNMYTNFAREIKTQVNSIQGTGLGLSIVKSMVDLMGGTIECISSPGSGTTFTVTIDFKIASVVSREKAALDKENVDLSDLTVLIAEDNDLNREILNELLHGYGISCDNVSNGKECVDRLKSKPANTYSAIFMDIHMPFMDGYEATKAIRALSDKELNAIPIIAMTADAFEEDIKKCLDCGMNGHVAKPIDLNKIIEYLTSIKNGRLL